MAGDQPALDEDPPSEHPLQGGPWHPQLGGGLWRWITLTGSRRTLALVLSGLVFLWLLGAGTVWEFELETLVRETRAVQTLFNTLLGGIILFVSVVLSINVAALSQEFSSLPVKQSQIEDSIEFQKTVEELAEAGVSPAGLGGFFSFILQAIRACRTDLRAVAAETDDAQLREELVTLAEGLAEVSRIESRLGRQRDRLSMLLLAALDVDYARNINLVRRIRTEHGDQLDGAASDLLEHVSELLTVLASGREYYTTLYFKRELRNLSRDLLFLALPVIVFTAYVLLAIDAGLFPSMTAFGIRPRLLYISLAFVIALSPYVLLSSYMLRIVTVSKFTLESTSFSLNEESF